MYVYEFPIWVVLMVCIFAYCVVLVLLYIPRVVEKRKASPLMIAGGDDLQVASPSLPNSYWDFANRPDNGEGSYCSVSLRQASSDGRLYAGSWFHLNTSRKMYVDYNLASSSGLAELTIGLYDLTTDECVLKYKVHDISTVGNKSGTICFRSLRRTVDTRREFGKRIRYKYTFFFQVEPEGQKVFGEVNIRPGVNKNPLTRRDYSYMYE